MTDSGAPVRWVRRFDAFDRGLHLAMMTSFMGLAATGLPLYFSAAPWAAWLSHAVGGFEAAGYLHRLFATVMLSTFAAHVVRLGHKVLVLREPIFWGPTSMVPQPRDFAEFVAHVRWFLGRGARPRFEHFTYWEKFDYWAVFWGMAIIGGSGLVLWFPALFARVLPGRIFNLALLVHGDEALLATGFIFLIHFFNGHFRPDKFPIDIVIFTGALPEHELQDEHPGEYDRLVAEGRLDAMSTTAPTPAMVRYGLIVGGLALAAGVLLLLLMLRAALL
jgi:cytochrome b subunit of formate dehydrogenase